MTHPAASAYIESGSRFVALAQGGDDASMAKIPEANEWSGAFIVHHMADFEIHFAHRILRMLTEKNPEIAGYSEEPYPSHLHYANRDWRTSLQVIEATRKGLGDVLSQLDESAFARPGVHSERGAITVADIVSSAAKHISAHTEQLGTALNS